MTIAGTRPLETLGIGCTWAVCAASDLEFALAPGPVWAGLGLATVVGLGFGAYPAERAARIDPIRALADPS